MTERPILFSAPMVRAILAGTKTQTRRVAKPQPIYDGRFAGGWKIQGKAGRESSLRSPMLADMCPYGQPGDRLWVRESTHRRPMLNLLTGEPLAPEHDGGAYTADDEDVLTPEGFDLAWWYSRKSCPSIHMPRWASRITLEITGVRVERLQDIDEQDAQDEGVVNWALNGGSTAALCTDQFRDLWQLVNGAGSWAANPWVWVVEFKRAA